MDIMPCLLIATLFAPVSSKLNYPKNLGVFHPQTPGILVMSDNQNAIITHGKAIMDDI